MKKKIITIDGGAGTGKTTVGKAVAEKFNLPFISTGKIFRVLAWIFREEVFWTFGKKDMTETVIKKIVVNKEFKLDSYIPSKDIKFLPDGNFKIGKKVVTDGQLNSEEIAKISSKLSEIKEIREIYEKIINREIKKAKDGIVMDGRDCGTVICPDTKYKFFLTCSPEAAAKHRIKDYKFAKVDFENLVSQIKTRNNENATRKLSPLIPANDAIIIDTSDLSVKEVVSIIIKNCKEIEKVKK